jgi:flagellar motor protein MotB
MSRLFFVGASLFVVLGAGCVTQSQHRAALARVEEESLSEIEGTRNELEVVTAKLAQAEKQAATLKAEISSVLKANETMKSKTNQLTAELSDLKQKYAGIDAALLAELKDLPGVAMDKQGAISVSGLSFETGGAKLKGDSIEIIRKIAEALTSRAGMIYVDGHTDAVPVKNPETVKLYQDNLGLSLARAAAVARVLIDSKIPPKRLMVRGFGSAQPVAPNDTAANRAKNRRVEIRLIPSQDE